MGKQQIVGIEVGCDSLQGGLKIPVRGVEIPFFQSGCWLVPSMTLLRHMRVATGNLPRQASSAA
jgi:hypothetical protein